LSSGVLEELHRILESFESDEPNALVIRSAKPSGFCMGADINEFKTDGAKEDVLETLTRGHALLDRVTMLPFPTVALLHGPCLGGGLELALACNYRIAIDGTTVAFPEIKLGLHPGLGGTFRLTRLIHPIQAMTMMLTGKTVHAEKAKKLGIVDAVTRERHAVAAARRAIGGVKPPSRRLVSNPWSIPPMRQIAAAKMRRKTESKAPPDHYPAPYSLIDLWAKEAGNSRKMQEAEIRSFANLLQTDTAQSLIRVFFLRQHLKSLAKTENPCQRVHVIGAGAMGGDIAAWCALQGLTATVTDVEIEPLAKTVPTTEKLCQRKHRNALETRDVLDRLIPDPAGNGVSSADLVIEAVPEKLDLKKKIYGDVEPRMKPGAILATNTSSIRLEDLAADLHRPERFVGLHFFNPVSQMMVVEIVRHADTADDVEQAAIAFADAIDKLPVPVASAPGFLVNRALTPYLLEAMLMVDEGVPKAAIDAAAEAFGFPMGPIELADQVGLDICASVAEVLGDALDEPLPEVPAGVRAIVEQGDLGRKTGRGLYIWSNGKPEKNSSPKDVDDVNVDRLVLPMIDACVKCQRQGTVADWDTIDGALIFATGFPPFRGGPIGYARKRGVGEIMNAMNGLAERYGPRFKPDAGWEHLS
jgi:3-hydroxyacyl-CoA dehydrogenase / enoyl-CoA hydratase / 3-hydroxybutyryl-CoA epimerase